MYFKNVQETRILRHKRLATFNMTIATQRRYINVNDDILDWNKRS